MQNITDDEGTKLIFSLINMLRNPEDIADIRIETMCATLEVLLNRIKKVDNSILSIDISEAEFKEYFEELFAKNDLELLGVEILNTIGEKDDNQ